MAGVGGVATVWHGVGTPPRLAALKGGDYAPGQVSRKRGAEMGRFLLGSTVVLLFPKSGLAFNAGWAPTASVRMGEAMGQFHG